MAFGGEAARRPISIDPDCAPDMDRLLRRSVEPIISGAADPGEANRRS
ncbi:hypothetical protein [Sphingomonas sp. Leaf10]|nr:hypothetical protein [Sphingomonas sp. Leaf10]